MSISGIQGQLLEVTVVGCTKLKDTEWISRQDPYVCVEYGSTKSRTRTHTDGGKNPTFQEKFIFTLIEGLREINVVVWNSNTLSSDDFIGSGKIQLQKVLSQGYDDSSWPLQTKSGRHAGEVRLIMHYPNLNKPAKSHAPSAPPNITPSAPQMPVYSAPPPPVMSYPLPANYMSSSPYFPHPPTSASYPPPPYYPQAPVHPTYPPSSTYTAPPYPPPIQGSQHYPPGLHPGSYPPRPY